MAAANCLFNDLSFPTLLVLVTSLFHSYQIWVDFLEQTFLYLLYALTISRDLWKKRGHY